MGFVILIVHSQDGFPGQRGSQQTQSASPDQKQPWAGSARPWSSIQGKEHVGKSPVPRPLWLESNPLTNWKYLWNITELAAQ